MSLSRRASPWATRHPGPRHCVSLPDSPIYTPRDGSLWTWAKLNLQVTDFLHSQIEQHLVKTHLLVEPFCVCLARQLPERHPLHQLLRYHCRGVMLANTVGSPTLTNPGHYTDQLFPLGHIGTREVVRRTWLQTSWDDTDFIQQMKVQSVCVCLCVYAYVTLYLSIHSMSSRMSMYMPASMSVSIKRLCLRMCLSVYMPVLMLMSNVSVLLCLIMSLSMCQIYLQNFSLDFYPLFSYNKNRGMDDKSLIPYFPYRDDGELIHTAINRMVQDYVNL